MPLCLSLTACGAAADTGSSATSEAQEDSKVSNSGSITYAMEDESPAIQNAPAYDTADAKKYIDSMPEIRKLVDSIEEASGGRFPVQTKAGWESGLDEGLNYDPEAEIPDKYKDGDPSNDECAINDTGIVYSDRGPYIFVIYTDHPFGVFRDYATENPLYGLAEKLYEVQCSLA